MIRSMGLHNTIGFLLLSFSLVISDQYVINDENNDAVWNQYDANWEENPFFLDDNAHVILKRDADDGPLEGAANDTKKIPLNSDPLVAAESELSGNEPVLHANSSLPEETPFDTAKDQIADDSPKEANEQIEEAPIEPAQPAQDEVVAVEEPAVQSTDDSATDEKSLPVDEAVASGSLNQTEPVLDQEQQAAEELVPVADVSDSKKSDEEKKIAPDEEPVPSGDDDAVDPIDQDQTVVEQEEQQPAEEPQPVVNSSDKESEPAEDVDAVGQNLQPAEDPKPVVNASEPIQEDDGASDVISAPEKEEQAVDAVVPVNKDEPVLDLDEQQTVEDPKTAVNASEAVNIDDDKKDIGLVDETEIDQEKPSVDAEFEAPSNVSGVITTNEDMQNAASEDDLSQVDIIGDVEQSEENNAESNVEEHEILKEPSVVEPVYYGNETEEHVPSGENGDKLPEQEQELLNENQESLDTNDGTGIELKENENGIDLNASAVNEELGGEAAVIVASVPLTDNQDNEDVHESAGEENPVIEEEQPIVEDKEGEPAGVEENGDSPSDDAPPPVPDSPPQDSDKKEEDTAIKPSSDDDSDLNPPPLIHNISTETPAPSSDKYSSSSSEDAFEATQKPKEAEVVDDNQSGNAILLKNPHTPSESSVEGSDTDKLLSNSPVNAKSKNLATENEPQPNTGESTTNVSKAGKDATILIVLFVIVIIIGAAALTHHFIKKRKGKISEEGEVGNGIRMADKNSQDIEKGTEMKPLIKSNNTVIVKEYSDKKNDAA